MIVTSQHAVVKELGSNTITIEGFNDVGEMSYGILRERKKEEFANVPFKKIYSGHVENISSDLIEELGGVNHLNNVLESLDYPSYVLIKQEPKEDE